MELNRAIHAADTTMSNAINAFNQLNYTKFIENVVENQDEADQKIEIEKLEQSMMENNTTFAQEMLSEKDKISFALAIAIQESTKKKKSRQEQGEGAEEDERDAKKLQKQQLKSGIKGIAASIKLPFVIG